MIGDFWIKSPIFNPPIIVHMYRFYRVTLQMQNGVAAVFKRTNKPKVPLPSNLNSLSESSLTWPDPFSIGHLSIRDYKRPLRPSKKGSGHPRLIRILQHVVSTNAALDHVHYVTIDILKPHVTTPTSAR